MEMDMFGLRGIDLLRCCCCRASTRLVTTNIHNRKHELPVADLYRRSWGRWRVSESVLQTATQTLTKYLKVEQQAHWLLIQQEPIRSAFYREWCDCKQIEL